MEEQTQTQPQQSEVTQTQGSQAQSTTPFPTASLYVGDLEPNVTESILFEIFKKVGPVASIRVCRDSGTRRSLGYAYVNFHRIEDAERALDTLNYTPITGGKPCRIMWSQRDPSLRKSGQGNIYIKNLDPSIQSQDLYDNFSQFGTILSCKVELDENSKSKGFGYVHFEEVEAANKAISQINGIELEGKKVQVMPFQTKKQRSSSTGVVKFTNIYIKNVPSQISEKDLAETFSQFGKVTSCVVMTDENGTGKGFGFLNFDTAEAAAKAVEALHEKDFHGQKLYVARAQKKAERAQQLRKQFEERKMKYQESNLYVKNLDDAVDDSKLHDLFSQYGNIVSAKVMKDENGTSKGFGFVCFSAPEEAHKAVLELNGRMLFNKPLYVALAQRKEVRSAQLQAQYAHRHGGKIIPGNLPFGQQPFPFVRNPNQPPFMGYPPQMMQGGMNPRARWGGRNQQHHQQHHQQQPHQQQPNQPNQQSNQPNQGGNVPYNRQQMPPKKQPNLPMNPIPNQQRNVQPQQQELPNNLSSIISTLGDLDEEGRKRVIGDHLYQKIDSFFKMNPEGNFNDSGKITGMLLESLDEQELINLAEDPNELTKRIEEAINVLQEHQN